MSYLVLQPGMVLSHSIEDYPDGIVVPVDKPYRWTSADVIRKVKWMAVKHFGKRNLKVGHAGTLDPLATGVLLVCIGKATKLAEEFQKAPKQYLAGVTFGATTASYDLEKEVDTRYPLDGVSEESLRGVLPGFIGEQNQVAPLFSAKSVDGVRVYELARKRYKAGLPVEEEGILQASRISIYDLQLVSFEPDCRGGVPPEGRATRGTEAGGPPRRGGGVSPKDELPKGEQPPGSNASNRINVASVPEGLPQAEILVDCSKGTYIRALARDLGEALGSGAFLHSLRRTRNGGFTVENALSIDSITAIFKTESAKKA
ncbi:MAG: tRNA pseudouridine(55) synthase TruB [Bacteroidales bacterium]|nr:tRNA pseudouridine(55) synthase TruB [Bacteroidales bacterium]